MRNKIKKINLNHSFIFFLLINVTSVLSFKFNTFNISTILCLILILTIGISHGSLDHIKGNPLIIDIVEPHKKRQGSITMIKKEFQTNS